MLGLALLSEAITDIEGWLCRNAPCKGNKTPSPRMAHPRRRLPKAIEW